VPEPSYDFFATGRPVADPPLPGGHATPPGGAAPVMNQFGTPVAPSGPAPAAFPVAPGSGYAPGAVNNFGTPLDVVAAPTGPFAAPGIASGPIDAPGMVSTWGSGVPHSHAAHAAPARAASQRPGAVLAVGIIAIVGGAFELIAGLLGLAALAAVSSSLAGTSGGSGVAGVVQILFVVLVAVGLLWIGLGIGACLGNRTSVRVLRVLIVIGTVLNVLGLIQGVDVTTLLTLAFDGVLLWLLFSTDTVTWLRER
jgi:hypothetical protein